MIIFGTKAVVVATDTIADACAHCGTTHSTALTVLQQYAHLFWIPLFPIGKTGVTECAHCKKVLLRKEFSPAINSSYKQLKAQSKTPVWTFAGLGLFAVFIIAGMINSKNRNAQFAQWIEAPQKGDIYSIRYDYKHYTLFRVENVQGDTVVVWPSAFESNKRRGLRAMKRRGPNDYLNEPITFLKADLQAKLDKGELIEVERQ